VWEFPCESRSLPGFYLKDPIQYFESGLFLPESYEYLDWVISILRLIINK